MPKSRGRAKADYTPPPAKAPLRVGSPRWLAPLMVACFVLGLLWIVIYYVTQQRWPIESIHNWNMAIGFGLIMAGFLLSTRWK